MSNLLVFIGLINNNIMLEINKHNKMKGIRLTSLILVLIIPGLKLFAQADSIMRFSLVDAQNYAIENFFLAKNAALDIESSRKQVWEYTSLGLPQLNAGADYAHIPKIPTMNFPVTTLENNVPRTDQPVTGNEVYNNINLSTTAQVIELGVKNNINYNLMLTQLIFSGEYLVGLKASKTLVKLSEEAYEKTKIELKQLVANSYYTILVLKINEKLLSESADNLKKISDETTKTAEEGLLDKLDADQIKINVKRIENQLNLVQRQLDFMQNMFKYQLGLNETANIELTDSLKSLVENNLVISPQSYTFDLNSHIDYQLLNTQEELKLLSLKHEKSLYLPTLSGFYKYQDNTNSAAFNFTMKQMLGVSLSVPIFSSGHKIARVGEAKIALLQSQNMKSQGATRLIMEAQQASFDYSSALERFNNEKENFELSKRILESTTMKFKQGMISSMDLTLTNNQYLQAQLTYSSSILDLLNAKVKMDKAYSKL
jgi:outer membrane protein